MRRETRTCAWSCSIENVEALRLELRRARRHVLRAFEEYFPALDGFAYFSLSLCVLLREPQGLEAIRLRNLVGELRGLLQRLNLSQAPGRLARGEVPVICVAGALLLQALGLGASNLVSPGLGRAGGDGEPCLVVDRLHLGVTGDRGRRSEHGRNVVASL